MPRLERESLERDETLHARAWVDAVECLPFYLSSAA